MRKILPTGFRALSSFCGGFGAGISLGLSVGYFLFIFFKSTDVKEPDIQPLAEQDFASLQRLLPEIPLWVKYPDYNRIDWLNKFIEKLWPYFDKAICKTARSRAEPIIAEHIRKYKIISVELKTLTLGSLPPTLQGMKVYITDENELIMEPSIRWAGNPNVIVAVKSFGLKANIQVVDLQIFASPRFSLKPLVPSFPCFAKIFMSLMDKPHVDFGLKLMGIDLMSIPGLYSFVQELIKDQVAHKYLWPKTLEVQILDPTDAQKKPVGILHVKILRAMKLRKKYILSASDPYVKLRLTESKAPSAKTTVKHNNLDPEWNEEFNIVVKDPETQSLELLVYDREHVGKDSKMGMNVVPLKGLPRNDPKVLTLDLVKTNDASNFQNEMSRSQLEVELTYKPFKEKDLPKNSDDSPVVQNAPEGTPAGGGLLVVIVHGAQDVEGEYHTNPYVNIIFEGDKRKTKLVNKNRNPRWNEEFHFTMGEPPMNRNLHVEVLSKSSGISLLHPKESLGYVHIPLNDVVSNERMNDKFDLIDSKNGKIQIELQWRKSS